MRRVAKVNKRPSWWGPSYTRNVRVRYETPDDPDVSTTFDSILITFDLITKTFDEE